MSKRLTTLLRHGNLLREEHGTIDFWRLKDDIRYEFEHSQYWSDDVWKSRMSGGGGHKKRFHLYWSVRTRNSLPPGSSGSFRTQSHWSYTSGQCVNSERFLRVHLSHRMCNQLTFHHKFKIDTRRTQFEQKTDGILHVCGSYEQGTQRSGCNWFVQTSFCMVQSENVEKTPRHSVLGRFTACSTKKDLSSVKHDVTQSSFPIHSQLIVSRKLLWWNLGKSYTRKYLCHLNLVQRFPFKIIGWKNWIQKSLEAVKTPNESNPNQKPNYREQWDPWVSNQKVRSLSLRK